MNGTDLVVDLALIMLVAAVTTVLFQRLRQPVVLGYLLAGVIVGPHFPVPLFANEDVAHHLSELGVELLMFSLGLELSLGKLVEVAPIAGVVAVIECSLQLWSGYALGRALGGSSVESLFVGAMLAISSTTIIVKAFAEQKIGGRFADLVFGVLVVEDLVAILLLAILTAIGSGAKLSPHALATTVARLVIFLLATLAFGMLIVPRAVRAILRLQRAETTVVAVIGLCFGFSLLARAFGYSVALGAFLGGALVAESGEGHQIAELIAPVRDMFAAIFFVSVGMLIDPKVIVAHWGVILAMMAVVVVGKVVGVSVGAFLTGNGVATSVRAGMSFAQIGELSFIIAALGLSLGAVRPYLYPVAVSVSALTALTTPWLIRAAGPVAAFLDRRLPHAVQTYASLYGAWIDRLREVRQQGSSWARIRRLVLRLLADVCGIAAVTIGASLAFPAVERAAARLGWNPSSLVARAGLIAVGVLLAAPFGVGAVRVARALGLRLALEALPADQTVDLSAAPRRALVVTIQIAILLAAGIPLLAVTQPFVRSAAGPVLLVLLLAALIVPLWRSATNLEEHVRAGAQVVVEELAAQGRRGHQPPARPPAVERVLAGIGGATPVRLAAGSPAIGRTLKQLALRGLTSAAVVAIDRGQAGLIFPTGDEALAEGDVLVLTGSREALEAAEKLLKIARAPGD
ncbi:MAG TPA: cation:proton antiporter [Polyangia bacterium]|nr:cation:proton antiporter [Polyangia bacterium]